MPETVTPPAATLPDQGVGAGVDHLRDRVTALHDSDMQAKLRRIRPWPIGCVFIEHPGMSLDDIREQFRLMRRLGFTALKQCQTCRGTDKNRVMHMALDEGIIPWWYGQAGWENPTPELLAALGIDADTSIETLREHRAWIARQDAVMRARIDGDDPPVLAGYTPLPPGSFVPPEEAEDQGDRLTAVDPFSESRPVMPGVQLSFDFELTDAHVPLFVAWLKRNYGDIDTLNDAWNVHHCMIPGPRKPIGPEQDDHDPADVGWTSWDHLAGQVQDLVNRERREYRRIRDVLRFKADIYLAHVRASKAQTVAADPRAPVRAGGEMGLFLPFASRGTDMEGIARLMGPVGSFYPSIHLAWHFEETDFEYARPVYMQAAIAADWFKGGWSATWESTGGPQQMTGHNAPFVPKARGQTPGFTVDAGVMTQLMLSWIAGGFRGFGLWAWNVRTAGWEGGEYGLLDRQNRPTDRAEAAGRIGQVCRRYRDELWQADKRPDVGVLVDWDQEAIWAAASRGGRAFWKSQPIRARLGASRALVNANIPWEHVTAWQLRQGLARRYRAIVMPAFLSISEDLLVLLREYVQAGGRVLLDAPGGWYDGYAALLDTRPGSAFEQLFGVTVRDYQYSREGNRVWSIDGRGLTGCTMHLEPTHAQVTSRFEHCELPAVTTNCIGDAGGAAVVLAHEATLGCFEGGQAAAEAHLLKHLLPTDYAPPYTCSHDPCYRLWTPAADHYFLINDRDRSVRVQLQPVQPGTATDLIAGEPIRSLDAVEVPAHSGRWVRVARE
jgi:beta-galactosidase